MNRIIFLSVILFCSVFNLSASTVDEAKKLYERADYSKAVELYETIAREKGTSAELFYNLGNAYVKSGDLGKAMLNFQRARLLNPSDKYIKQNIDYVASKVEDNNRAEIKGRKISVKPQSISFFKSLKNTIAFSILPDTWAKWSAAFFILTCCCIAVYTFTSTVILRKIGFFGGFILLGLSLIFMLFAFIGVRERDNIKRGVIISHKEKLYKEPYQSSPTLPNALTRGTLLDIVSEEQVKDAQGKEHLWYKVILNDDYIGWIEADNFEKI